MKITKSMKGIVLMSYNHIISLNQLNNQLNVHIIMFSFQSSVQCSRLLGGGITPDLTQLSTCISSTSLWIGRFLVP